MALDQNKISKKAKDILDQIVKERGKGKDPKKLKLSKNNTEKKNRSNFDTTLYKNLVISNKAYFWISISIALGSIFLLMIFRVIKLNLLDSEISNMYQPEIPKLEQNLKNLSENIAVKNKKKNEELENIRKSLTLFSSEEKARAIVDDITRLFEVGNILILKQEVNFSASPYLISENVLDNTKPPEEVTAFSEVKQETILSTIKKENKNKPNNDNQITNALNKNKYTIAASENSKISLDMKNNIPSELAFFNMKLMLKGSYVNYVRARNALTRVIPSANIILEEIVVSKAKKNVEIRMIVDIPYKKY
jgi:hypothetical protein